MANIPYYEQKDRENTLHLREMIRELPPYCADFFRGIEPQTSSRTRIADAYVQLRKQRGIRNSQKIQKTICKITDINCQK